MSSILLYLDRFPAQVQSLGKTLAASALWCTSSPPQCSPILRLLQLNLRHFTASGCSKAHAGYVGRCFALAPALSRCLVRCGCWRRRGALRSRHIRVQTFNLQCWVLDLPHTESLSWSPGLDAFTLLVVDDTVLITCLMAHPMPEEVETPHLMLMLLLFIYFQICYVFLHHQLQALQTHLCQLTSCRKFEGWRWGQSPWGRSLQRLSSGSSSRAKALPLQLLLLSASPAHHIITCKHITKQIFKMHKNLC